MDKKAKQILFNTYWSSTGWKDDDDRNIKPKDFIYAKSKGVMFDNLSITGQELLKNVKILFKSVSLKKVTDAFLSSFTSNRLDWRSGLGSYSNIKRVLEIETFKSEDFEDEDLNVLNFERIKWGGIRHSQILYNWLDLTLLEKESIPEPTQNDLRIFSDILNSINESPAEETAAKLRDRLKKVFKASKDQRHVLLEILGCSEILKPLSFERLEPSKHDWEFVLFWRGEDKYNSDAVNYFFGNYGQVKIN